VYGFVFVISPDNFHSPSIVAISAPIHDEGIVNTNIVKNMSIRCFIKNHPALTIYMSSLFIEISSGTASDGTDSINKY